MGRKKNLHTKSNSGFSMITVILAVALVGILVMLVAYMVIANFRMKMAGLKEKDAFYTAEKALEEIRAGLQEDEAQAMSEAYTNVMESYNGNVQQKDVSMDAQRQAAYEQQFLNILQKRLKGSQQIDEYYDMERLRDYVDLDKESSFDNQKESLVVTNPAKKLPQMIVDREKKQIVVKNIRVIYVDARGHTAIIQTDIQLGIPEIQFPTPSTLPDLMNMIVVAGKGIYCKAGNATDVSNNGNEIQGSVYAGIIPEEKLRAAGITGVTDTSIYLAQGRTLQISKGERTVCVGEISLGNQAVFSSAAEATLWAQGVNLSSAQVELLGKTYLSDDLTVKSGTGSYVKLAGEYYGYGDVESAMKSHNQKVYTKENKTAAALSSAITINGKNTTLDMSGLEKLLLAGKNYISSKKLSTNSIKNNDDVLTGESVTVKGTQLAYLVPDALMGDYHNPMSYQDYMDAAGLQETDTEKQTQDKIKQFTKKIQVNKPVKALGNKSLSEIGVDDKEPIQTVFYNDGGTIDGGYVYFYLHFSDEKKASEFMQTYYNKNPSLKKAMDSYLSFYFKGKDSGIYVNDSSAYLRYVVGGNVLSYNGNTKTGKLSKGTSEETSAAVTEEETGYQNMWYALKRKMIGSYDLLKTEVKDSEGIAHNEADSDRSVFDNLVNEKEMVRFIEKQVDSDQYDATYGSYTFTASEENDGLQTIMANNGEHSTFPVKEGDKIINKTIAGKNKELVITADKAKKLRLVVCTGDVKIASGVKFYGIIMAKGTITLEPGAKLVSSPIDAAKAFQSQVNSSTTEISPKDFFWEGDKYVLGNSQSSNHDKNSDRDNNIYHVEDYVSYKNWKKM